MTSAAITITIVATIGLFAFATDALQLGPAGRREILQQGGAALAIAASGPAVAAVNEVPLSLSRSDDDDDYNIRQIFRSLYSTKKQAPPALSSRTIGWSPPSKPFSQLRYSTSSLSTMESAVPESSCESLPRLPSWMEGHWLITYKFDGVSFPNGRDEVSLKLPGTGLGTCAVLPNVGMNPSPFVQRFGTDSGSGSFGSGDENGFVVEDVAYNLPRKFEGFWPEAKVSSVRVSTSARAMGTNTKTKTTMGPACLVTGEGCSFAENPDLHGRHATRCQMEYQGPTRRGGLRTQHLDLSMVDCSSTSSASVSSNEEDFLMARSFVQYNQEQELTSYYREFVSYDRQQQSQSKPPDGNNDLRGRTCVAAFLPSSQEVVAVYRYKMKLCAITEEEAKMY